MPYTPVALITGVSRATGLGFETARQLAEKGFLVILTARNTGAVQELTDQLTGDEYAAEAYSLDICSDNSVKELSDRLAARYGRIDVLINNAGGYFDADIQPSDTDLALAKDAFDTNVLGAWRMIQAFLPLLKKSAHPRIVNVSSGAGSFSDPVFGLGLHPNIVPMYSITKLALNGLTVKLARQLKEAAIKINAVCPGFVATYPDTEQWGARPVADGARGIVWAATLPDDGPSGGFFRDGQALNW